MSDHIQCGCGAKLITSNQELIKNFDLIHSNDDHQKLIMHLKLAKAEAKYVQP
jgi:hypothetical protein